MELGKQELGRTVSDSNKDKRFRTIQEIIHFKTSPEASCSSPSAAGMLRGFDPSPRTPLIFPPLGAVLPAHTPGRMLQAQGNGRLSRFFSCWLSVTWTLAPSTVGSGRGSIQWGDCWLGSGSGVGLMTSSMGLMVNGNSQFTSTHSSNAAPLSTFSVQLGLRLGVQSDIIEGAEAAVQVMSLVSQI